MISDGNDQLTGLLLPSGKRPYGDSHDQDDDEYAFDIVQHDRVPPSVACLNVGRVFNRRSRSRSRPAASGENDPGPAKSGGVDIVEVILDTHLHLFLRIGFAARGRWIWARDARLHLVAVEILIDQFRIFFIV